MENCNTIAFRFATGFGLSSRLRLDLLINDFVYTALKQRYLVIYESQFMRTFIHVYDIARSYLFGIENSSKMQGQIYNVGGDRMNYSKRQVCELIRQKLEFYLHYAEVGEDADKRNYVVSYNKIAALGYKTTITVEQGIDEVIRGLAAIDVRIPFSNV
jgi:nucleoside-diphosphate-sugar epimerase